MQVDSGSKIIYVHIPRTGGSWFTYAWPSNLGEGKIAVIGNNLKNFENGMMVATGRHGRLSGIKEKLDAIDYDYADHKIITMVREPFDRVASSWVWFSQVKSTAQKHGWATIDDMLDEFESGVIRANYLPQTHWLEEQDAVWDRIFRFEDVLGNSSVVQKEFPLFNKNKKNNNLTRTGTVRSRMLSEKQKDRIRILYKDDFRYLEKYYK